MRKLREWILRFGGLFNKQHKDKDLTQEIESHLQLHIEDNLRLGMTPEEARRQALITLGGIECTKEGYRDQRSLPWLETLLQDLRYGLRVLRQNPGFTATAVLTLAVASGANTAIFSLINAVILKSLPVNKPEELVLLGSRDTKRGEVDYGFYHSVFRKLRDQNDVLTDIAASAPVDLNITMAGRSEPLVSGQLISGNYLSLLGVNPVVGRNITVEDDRIPGEHPVAMISYGFWQRRFGLEPSVVGKVIQIDGTSFTIVGVTPPRFLGLEVGRGPDILVPIMMQAQVMPATGSWLDHPVNVVNWLHLVGRLRGSRQREQAQTALGVVYQRIMADEAATADPKWAGELKDSRLFLTPGGRGFSVLRSQFTEPLTILMAFVSLVLLIACANVANLLLSRAAARQREIAIRLAIGAKRIRLVRQLLTESLLLATMGAALGLMLAFWSSGVLVHFIARGRMPIVLDLTPDLKVFAFVTTISGLTAMLFGLIPALHSTGLDFSHALKPSGRGTREGTPIVSTSNLLVVSQIALSLLLLIGASLFVRSLHKLAGNSLVFEPDHVLVARVEPAGSDQKRGSNAIRLSNIYSDLQERIEAIPTVRAAGLASIKPTAMIKANRKIKTVFGGELDASMIQIFPRYFSSLGLQFLAGRDINDTDMATNAPLVAVINETLARRAFLNQNPVGQELRFGSSEPPVSVIGVVSDTKYGNLRGQVIGVVYQPFLQANTGRGQMILHVRASGSPQRIITQVQREIVAADANMPAFQVQTLATEFEASLVQERLVAALSSLFGLLALALACIGLYGILTYKVARRTHEIGVRLALGAQQRDVLALIVGQGLLLAIVGVAVGLISAVALTRLVRGFLFGVSTMDPATFMIVPLLLMGMALLACWWPARRGAKIDPMVALRYE